MNLLTVDEVAERLGVNKKIVRHWLRLGKIRGKQTGRMWFVTPKEVERLKGREMDRRKRGAVKSRWK